MPPDIRPDQKDEYTANGAITSGNCVAFTAADTVGVAANDSAVVAGAALETVANGERATVALTGIVKMVASAAIAAGALVVSAGAGKVKAGTFPATHNATHVVGRATTAAAADGDPVYVNLAC